MRNFSSASTASFSIHKVAEQKGVRFGDIEANVTATKLKARSLFVVKGKEQLE